MESFQYSMWYLLKHARKVLNPNIAQFSSVGNTWHYETFFYVGQGAHSKKTLIKALKIFYHFSLADNCLGVLVAFRPFLFHSHDGLTTHLQPIISV